MEVTSKGGGKKRAEVVSGEGRKEGKTGLVGEVGGMRMCWRGECRCERGAGWGGWGGGWVWGD